MSQELGLTPSILRSAFACLMLQTYKTVAQRPRSALHCTHPVFRHWISESYLPLVLVLSIFRQRTYSKNDECGGQCCYSQAERDGSTSRAVSADVENRIERYLRTADATPGAAVVIVIGEEIVYARGFGFRDLASCAKAASNTRFYLKSTTKTLLGLSAAQLHEEGASELDAPIAEYLPDLKLPEGLSSQQVSVRSHIIHTQPYFDAGLNYRTAFPGNLPESEFVEHANEFSVVGDIKFRYSNFGPIIAAHAITAKTGIGWRELIAHKVFEPVGWLSSPGPGAGNTPASCKHRLRIDYAHPFARSRLYA